METPIATAEDWTLLLTDGGDLIAVERTDCGERYHTTEQVRSNAASSSDLSANEVIRRFCANADTDVSKPTLYQDVLDAMKSRAR